MRIFVATVMAVAVMAGCTPAVGGLAVKRLRRMRNRLLLAELWISYDDERVEASRLVWRTVDVSETTTRYSLTPLGLANTLLAPAGWVLYLCAHGCCGAGASTLSAERTFRR